MKKIRRQRREEREKERQLNIQVGLLEPPKAKVRLSNMARVYGADGVIDATAIEMKVREAQAERQAAHEDRNLARKLTTEERKVKRLRKMFDDAAPEVHVEVFRVNRMNDGRAIYKVDINAVENRLTGVCVCTEDGINVVVVEGERKGIKRFNRLMLHRIDWNPMVNMEGADESMFEELNKCFLVWQGVVAMSTFESFKRHKFATEAEARQFLAKHGAVQYWDAAANFDPDGIAEGAI
jgi:U4/U6 small nuclear ribonucleoprotein PRP3